MHDLFLAVVVDDSPLTVRVKGDLVDTVAQQKDADLPALAADDEVLVGIFDRKVVVLHKLADA